MLHDNIKALRKEKGITQEELAARLNVVRQTVSKWEKGLSVPDSGMLVKLSEELDIPVSRLLGAAIAPEEKTDALAEQLARINEQLAIRNRRARRIWTAVAVIAAGMLLFQILVFASVLLFRTSPKNVYTETIEWVEPVRPYCP